MGIVSLSAIEPHFHLLRIRSLTPSRHRSTGARTDLCSIALGSSIIELGPNFVIVHRISAYIPWATYPLCR